MGRLEAKLPRSTARALPVYLLLLNSGSMTRTRPWPVPKFSVMARVYFPVRGWVKPVIQTGLVRFVASGAMPARAGTCSISKTWGVCGSLSDWLFSVSMANRTSRP